MKHFTCFNNEKYLVNLVNNFNIVVNIKIIYLEYLK